jgi:hypothetical protein
VRPELFYIIIKMMYYYVIIMMMSSERNCAVGKRIEHRAGARRRHSAKPVSRAWVAFSKRLALVLSKLEEDQYLIVSVDGCNRFIQFACEGEEGMRVEVVSNNFLKGKDRLNRRQISWLRTNGWKVPNGRGDEATPAKDPSGSPNYFVDLPASVAAGDIARLAVEALVHGLEIPSPASLVYGSFERNGRDLRFEELGLTPAVLKGSRLMEKVLEVFREVTGLAELQLDEDGDVSVLYKELIVYATPIEDKVRLASRLANDVVETPALLHTLNELNIASHGSRCVFHRERIFLVFDIPANPFFSEYLALGIKEFSDTAEKLAFLLRDEFSGKEHVSIAAIASYFQ